MGAKLLEIRNSLGLSQGQLIEYLGLTPYINRPEISDFENGVREPDLLTLLAYARKAGVLVDQIIDDDLKLPEQLSGTEPIRQTGEESQQEQAKTTTVTLQLLIENDDGAAGAENRARGNIEKAHLKQYGMKKLKDGEYELKISHQGDADLDEQIYTLLGTIYTEAKRNKCSVKTNVQEKGAARSW
jgi:transcriptional regulator with XRE-family HTH domain